MFKGGPTLYPFWTKNDVSARLRLEVSTLSIWVQAHRSKFPTKHINPNAGEKMNV